MVTGNFKEVQVKADKVNWGYYLHCLLPILLLIDGLLRIRELRLRVLLWVNSFAENKSRGIIVVVCSMG